MAVHTTHTCYPDGWDFLLWFPGISSIHIHMSILVVLFGFQRRTMVGMNIMLFSLILNGFTWVAQQLFRQERPHLACVPYNMSKFGMPSPEIVSVTATTIAFLLHWFFFIRKNEDKKRKKKKKRLTRIQWIVYIGSWTYLIYCLAITIFISASYPILSILFAFVSIEQALVSVTIALVCNMFLFFYILQCKKVKKDNGLDISFT